MASGDGYGAKSFTKKELEFAVRDGVALEPAPVWVGLHKINLQEYFVFLSN